MSYQDLADYRCRSQIFRKTKHRQQIYNTVKTISILKHIGIQCTLLVQQQLTSFVLYNFNKNLVLL